MEKLLVYMNLWSFERRGKKETGRGKKEKGRRKNETGRGQREEISRGNDEEASVRGKENMTTLKIMS